MKQILSLFLALILLCSLAACGAPENTEETAAPITKSDYVLSDEVDPESVIDGVMTEIATDDPVLKKSTASWLDDCVLYEVNIRQFTEEGTFSAFEPHLERLQKMGVNTLWLMPIHPISETNKKGTLGSYYAVSDYRAVNPEFGTMEEFQHLLDKAHEMGFKVILDWVANHTGWDNAWLTEHEDWYKRDDSGEIESPYDWTDVAQLDYSNYEMRAEMIDCMRYWIEEIGVDGFRCDHAIGVPATFWNAAVYELKSKNSEIMMLAEAAPAASLTGYAFDCCYNDILYGQATMILTGVGTSSIGQGMPIGDNYAEGSFPMNYLDNHDKNSYENSIVRRYKDAYQTLLTLTFLTPGLPLIYTSDEMGYDHELEFFEKDPVPWDDEPQYAPLITALSTLKHENPALKSSNTDLSILEPTNSKLFAFTRTAGDNTVIYLSNLYYDTIEDIGVDIGFDSATCVLHHDGTTLDTTEVEMTKADFEKRSYNPYEFYVLVVNG